MVPLCIILFKQWLTLVGPRCASTEGDPRLEGRARRQAFRPRQRPSRDHARRRRIRCWRGSDRSAHDPTRAERLRCRCQGSGGDAQRLWTYEERLRWRGDLSLSNTRLQRPEFWTALRFYMYRTLRRWNTSVDSKASFPYALASDWLSVAVVHLSLMSCWSSLAL